MVSRETLSSDLKFIKEVEELKLKQKLLIESLKKRDQGEQNKLFLEINSKLDFLVNIFNEANHPEEENTAEEEDKFTSIMEKLNDMAETFSEKLAIIEGKLNNVTKIENKCSTIVESGRFTSNDNKDDNKDDSGKDNSKDDGNSVKTGEVVDVSSGSEPPLPEFESEIANTEKKKRKWF